MQQSPSGCLPGSASQMLRAVCFANMHRFHFAVPRTQLRRRYELCEMQLLCDRSQTRKAIGRFASLQVGKPARVHRPLQFAAQTAERVPSFDPWSVAPVPRRIAPSESHPSGPPLQHNQNTLLEEARCTSSDQRLRRQSFPPSLYCQRSDADNMPSTSGACIVIALPTAYVHEEAMLPSGPD